MNQDAAPAAAPTSERRHLAWLAAASISGFAILMLAWFLLPVDDWLARFAAFADGLGWPGILILSAAYVVGTVLLVPGFPMTLAAAVAYGWGALLICFFGGLLAASISFFVARFLARDFVRRMIEKRPVLKAVDAVAGEDGFVTILLARLTPVTPFAVENYAFGVTGIRFWPFLLGSALGIVPGTVMNVWIGVLGRTAATGEAGLANWLLLGVGFAATVILTVWMTRKAKRKLAEDGVAPA
jgi:uncharacterized membrane protein YdjX (TVP38/TMEM64 family)